jgi:hypothetical protein
MKVSSAIISSIQSHSISTALLPFLDFDAFLDAFDFLGVVGDGLVALRSRSTWFSSPCPCVETGVSSEEMGGVKKDAILSEKSPICAGHLASGCASADES